jgi:hypothetical protein
MRKIILLLFLSLLFFNSCQYFDKQIPSKEELLQKELKTINWKEVDEFPSFSQCDSVSNKEQNKNCFFEYLTLLIQERLSFNTTGVLYPQLDTIDVKVTVLPNSTLLFEPQLNDTLSYDKPKIDSIIRARLVGFPKVNPAIKRGIPVKTQFILPVILKVE